MSEVEIAIVVSPRDWAERLHRFVAAHGGARVRARILDARSALDEQYEVLLVDDLTSFVTARLVAELHGLGRVVVGLYDPREPWGREHLHEIGVREIVPNDVEPEAILRRIQERAAGPPPISAPIHAPVPADAPARRSVRTGRVLAVTGHPGAGVTEIACALAGALAGRGDAVLVDADTRGPSVAQRLDLPLHPNLRTAIDAVEHRSGRLEDTVVDLPGGGPRVVCGLADATTWADVRPEEVAAVVTSLRGRADVVVDAGTGLESLPTPLGLGRFDVARRLVELADVVVAVAAPTPTGVTRLTSLLLEVRALTSRAVLVAVNRAPSSRFKRTEVEEEIARSADVASIGFVPDDRRVGEAAWDGRLVTGGGFGRAVAVLAGAAATAAARPGTAARPNKPTRSSAVGASR